MLLAPSSAIPPQPRVNSLRQLSLCPFPHLVQEHMCCLSPVSMALGMPLSCASGLLQRWVLATARMFSLGVHHWPPLCWSKRVLLQIQPLSFPTSIALILFLLQHLPLIIFISLYYSVLPYIKKKSETFLFLNALAIGKQQDYCLLGVIVVLFSWWAEVSSVHLAWNAPRQNIKLASSSSLSAWKPWVFLRKSELSLLSVNQQRGFLKARC